MSQVHFSILFLAIAAFSVEAGKIFARNDLTVYDGKLTDEKSEWNSNLANPKSLLFATTQTAYQTDIAAALIAKNSTLYQNVQVTVTEFNGERLSTAKTGTTVTFVIGLPNSTPADDVDSDLEKGAILKNFLWRNVDVLNSGLPPLPEPDRTPGWQEAARMFKESINFTADPCQDFFSYSCDNYIKQHPLKDAPTQSTFDELQKDVFANLTKAIESLQATITEKSETIKVTNQIYQACKADTNESYIGSHILQDIANGYGGWPLLDPNWDIKKVPQNIYYAMGDMFNQYGVPTLFTPQVEIDAHNIQRHILYLDEASLTIPADYYRSPNLTQRYQQVLKDLIYQTVRSMDKNVNNDTILPQIDRMVEIEYHLAMISVNASEQRNMSQGYNDYNVSTATSAFPAFNWTAYFKGLVGNIYLDDPSQLLNPFIIAEPRRYGRDLNTFLDEANKDPTSKMKDLVNYLIFRVLTPFTQFADPELSRIFKEFRKDTRFGEVQITDKEQDCAMYLAQNLPYAAGRLYVDASFPAQNRDDVMVMINNVLSAFSSSLSGLRWMDNVSALKAFQKVAGLVRNVAYADWEMDDTKLDNYHKSLIDAVKSIDPKEKLAYYKYNSEVVKFAQVVLFQKLKQPGDRTEFGMSSAIVNAWYQPIRNSITFPAAILNQPFYRYDFPQAVNYGGLGVVMGHELSHGFDDQGVQFDWDGTLRTWMTPLAESGFTKMAQCVVDEYSRFCYPQACINGITTQGENIGDNGGLKAAYRAYEAYTASHGEEKRLPGLETFTMDQIFFLSFGQVWCGSFSEDALTKQLLTNPHSPGRDRVLGAVQNFAKFGEAFNCKKGDPMYPVNACDVW